MPDLSKALCWAAAIVMLAAANAAGLVADDTAQVLFVVLPVIAVISLRRNASCLLRRNGNA